MTAQRFLPVFGLLALLALPSMTRSQETLTYSDLAKRMTDLAQPAVLPAAGETCQQWSSYDRFSDGVVPTGPIALGTFDLSAGQHTLTVEIVGANPQAKKAYMFGVDQIELKPVR